MTEPALLCLCSDSREHAIRRAVLEEAGYEVLTASSAAEALQMVRFRRFVALVVDSSGHAEITPFLRKLRERTGDLPLVDASGTPAELRRKLMAVAPVNRRAAA